MSRRQKDNDTRPRGRLKSPFTSQVLVALVLCLLLAGCKPQHTDARPSIKFDKAPPIGEGGPVPLSPVSGRVTGARPGDKILLFARAGNGIWWVQPQAIQPFITIQPIPVGQSPHIWAQSTPLFSLNPDIILS